MFTYAVIDLFLLFMFPCYTYVELEKQDGTFDYVSAFEDWTS